MRSWLEPQGKVGVVGSGGRHLEGALRTSRVGSGAIEDVPAATIASTAALLNGTRNSSKASAAESALASYGQSRRWIGSAGLRHEEQRGERLVLRQISG